MSRADKVSEEIKREVSRIIQEKVHDPRLGFITITRVELVADLRFARIFYSVYGSEEDQEKTQEAMERATGFIRHLLGEHLNLRFVPEIIFKIDHSPEYSILLQKAFEEIEDEKTKSDTKKTSPAFKKKKQ